MHSFASNTTAKLCAGTVIGTKATTKTGVVSIIPQRFNSTSKPAGRSIVRPELNSVSEPKIR